MFDEPIHAPVENIVSPFFDARGLQLFIKREDLSHPFISGNKWRKLKYFFREAERSNKKHLVSFGGAYSNHLLALACAAAKYGFGSTGFVRGERVQNHMLRLCEIFGMYLIFVSRESYQEKTALFDEHFKGAEDAYMIPEGGFAEEGIRGCTEILDDLDVAYEHIFCSIGTGATFAGLVRRKMEMGLRTSVEGISVLKGIHERSFLDQLKIVDPGSRIHTGFHEGGYARNSEALMAFIQKFASETGILLDHVYEGKMMKAIYSLAAENYFKPGSKILALHCGGILGLLSQGR